MEPAGSGRPPGSPDSFTTRRRPRACTLVLFQCPAAGRLGWSAGARHRRLPPRFFTVPSRAALDMERGRYERVESRALFQYPTTGRLGWSLREAMASSAVL